MSDYASEKYLEAKNEFIQLRDDELILPEGMEFREWSEFIDEMRKGYSVISDHYGKV